MSLDAKSFEDMAIDVITPKASPLSEINNSTESIAPVNNRIAC